MQASLIAHPDGNGDLVLIIRDGAPDWWQVDALVVVDVVDQAIIIRPWHDDDDELLQTGG